MNDSLPFIMCRIPTTAADREKWIKAIGLHQTINQIKTGFHICELHFEPAAIVKRKKFFTYKSGTVSTIFSHEPCAKRKKMYVFAELAHIYALLDLDTFIYILPCILTLIFLVFFGWCL